MPEEYQPKSGTIEDDLRSRLACVLEATYWDRPYDERMDAIRGMCDLTQNGFTAVPADEKVSRLCTTDRHPSCSGCSCTCHAPMSVEAARAVILRTAGARLWPDDPTRLVEEARRVDPFGAEFLAALDRLGLS